MTRIPRSRSMQVTQLPHKCTATRAIVLRRYSQLLRVCGLCTASHSAKLLWEEIDSDPDISLESKTKLLKEMQLRSLSFDDLHAIDSVIRCAGDINSAARTMEREPKSLRQSLLELRSRSTVIDRATSEKEAESPLGNMIAEPAEWACSWVR